MRFGRLVLGLAAALFAGHAQAALTVSTKPTQNVTCDAGVCTATAKKAVLNVTDLANMLASGDVRVVSGGLAQDINVNGALSWTSTHRLTLDSFHSIAFNKPVSITGAGALTITTNDGGSGGDFQFFGKGHVEFWDLSSFLTIDGNNYALAKSVKEINKLGRQRRGFIALARSFDAGKDGTYSSSPLNRGAYVFEGLGNRISNLNVTDNTNGASVALITNMGVIRDIGVVNATITAMGGNQCVAALTTRIGQFESVENSYASGSITAGDNSIIGGLVCSNQFGVISRSHTDVAIAGGDAVTGGGLVGINEGCHFCALGIDQSYSTGAVQGGANSLIGGLTGRSLGSTITNSYVLGATFGGDSAAVGGLVGSNENDPTEGALPYIRNSYSAGDVSGSEGAATGGLVGQDLGDPGIKHTYWNLDTSGISDPSQGAGNIANDPGITGLTDAQLKSELPVGFSKSIWRQRANINGGYPYLLSAPLK